MLCDVGKVQSAKVPKWNGAYVLPAVSSYADILNDLKTKQILGQHPQEVRRGWTFNPAYCL